MTKLGTNIFSKSGNIKRSSKAGRVMAGRSQLGTNTNK